MNTDQISWAAAILFLLFLLVMTYIDGRDK